MSASSIASAHHPVVLVTDDEPSMRIFLAGVLSDADFQTVEACNAAEAFEVLQSRDHIDALLTDVEMPGLMDGLALAKIARRGWPHLAIMVLSGRPLPYGHELPERCVFLSKPFDSFGLLNQLRVQLAMCGSA